MIGAKGKELCNINHFQLSMHCDLDLELLDPEINRTHPRLMGSLCMKFHYERCKGKAIMRHQPFYITLSFLVINALCS